MKKILLGLLITACACTVAAFATACGGTEATTEHTHTYGEWTVTTAATCTTDGNRTRTCTGCDETETETVEKLGHDWATTLTVGGTSHWHACNRTDCEAKDEEAHIYDSSKTATAEDYDCTVCGYYDATDGLSFQGYKMNGEYFEQTTGDDIEFYWVVWTEGATGHIRIPLTYNGKPVTGIDGAFSCNTDITGVTIKDNITRIGSCAFMECTSLTGSLVIPDSVTYIGGNAFSDTGITGSLVIPDSVTYIGSSAFYRCEGITSVTFGSKVKTIGEGAFSGTGIIGSLVIPDSVTYIGSSAFYRCEEITSVTFGSKVKTIGEEAFSGTGIIGSLVIPDSVTTIDRMAFSECRGITSVTIGKGVTSVGESAFNFCTGLETGQVNYTGTISSWATINFVSAFANPSYLTNSRSLYIGGVNALQGKIVLEGIESIGSNAFVGCTAITGIEIPASVTSIGFNAFNGCTGLNTEGVYYNGDVVTWCAINFSGGSSNPLRYAHELYVNDNNSEEYYLVEGTITIPAGQTAIGKYIFYGCTTITSVVIPASVTSIGAYAFADCANLTNATFGNTEGWSTALTTTWRDVTLSSSNLSANATLLTSDEKDKNWKWTAPAA